MIKIFSEAQPGLLLHIIVRQSDFSGSRKDVVDSDEFIQAALLSMSEGDTFKPHQHVFKKGPSNIISQECWIVLSGSVAVDYFDVNGQKLCTGDLSALDMSITLRGGHNYRCDQNGTRVVEFKTGPYTGQENDKVFI